MTTAPIPRDGPSPSRRASASGEPLTILLVEDNPGDARLVAESLRRAAPFAYTLEHVETLGDAVDLVGRSEPDLVLLDLSLPDSAGVDTIRGMLDVAPGVAVVVLTGSDDEEMAAEAVRLGAQDYLVKGVHNGEFLRHAVLFATGRRRLVNEVESHSRRLEMVSAELTAVLDGTPTPTLVVDEDGVVRRVNRAAAEFARRSIDEMLGLRGGDALRCLRARDAVHGCGTGPFCEECPIREAVNLTLDKEEVLRRVPMAMTVQGSEGPVDVQLEVSTSPVATPHGRMVVVCAEDVTERHDANERVRRSEASLRVLLGNLRGLAYRCTREPGWPMDFVSAGFEDLTGFAPDELSEGGRVLYERVIHPDDAEAVRDRVEAAGVGEAFELEYRIVTRDGDIRWVWERGQNVGTDDAGRTVLEGFIADVTAKRRAEEAVQASERRYRQLFERNQAGVFRSTLDGRILACNDAFARMFGLGSPAAVDRIEAHQLYVSPEDRDRLVRDLEHDGQVTNHEMRGRRLDGEEIWVLENVGLVEGDEGETLLEGTVIDVTERKRMEEQLRQAQKMEAIGQLAGGVAHDFNNLLQALGGLVEECRVPDQDHAGRHRALDEMASLVERGARLTRQMLLFSRHETPRPEVVDLNDVVRTSEGLLRRLLRENISLRVELQDRPAVVEADRGQLGQVLMNLAVNAADAMAQGGALLIRVGAENGHVLIEVADTGHGIPDEVRERIFEPFFTTKERGKGTGLGLSVVHGIVTSNGGSIDVSSRPGEGTTFSIRLPRSEATPATKPASVEESRAVAAPDEVNTGIVLVVDDEPAVREVLRRMLDRQGFEVETAGTLAEALGNANGSGLALLVTDMVLPDGNGLDLVAAMRERTPGLPALLVSGYTEQEASVHEASVAGTVHFLQKPFSVGDLNAAVSRALAGVPGAGGG